jgi:hypothetical protein
MVRESKKAAAPQETEKSEAKAKNGGASEGNGAAGTQGMPNGEALAAMMRANQVLLEGMTAMQREIMEFGNARLRQDLETQEELKNCKDIQEAFRMQAEFAQKAMQQYAEEMSKLVELSTKIGRECWAPWEEATRATLNEATKRSA